MGGLWHCEKPHTFIKRQNASTFAATLWLRPPFPATTCRHRRKGKVPLHEKKGIDTKQDLTCLWPRQKCVKCPEDFLLGLLDMSPAIICLSFAYCFRKNGGKCHGVLIYSSTNQRRIDICRMWWSLDGSFSQSDSKSNKASSNLIFWNSFVFKYIYMDLCIYIYIQCSSCLWLM